MRLIWRVCEASVSTRQRNKRDLPPPQQRTPRLQHEAKAEVVNAGIV
jgi:hypothetical protein